ncbi:MAG: anthranilate synthase component II [Gemmatimonadaceae bacterium]
MTTVLVIDNYDSFTWNLVQYLGELGATPLVRRNDAIAVDRVGQLSPDAIILSPGPCTPDEAGITVPVVRTWGSRIPILGVCLGHQAIAVAYGGRVVRAARVMHGKTSQIDHTGADIFAGLPSPLEVMRYHSLIVDPASLPDDLEIVARTAGDESEIQAMRHTTHAVWGVQFHPESVLTHRGRDIIRNFLDIAQRSAAC